MAIPKSENIEQTHAQSIENEQEQNRALSRWQNGVSQRYQQKHIRRPLLVRAIKAAGLGIIPFLTIIGHAFSYQASAVMLL